VTALVAVLAFPFFLVDVPPVLDYPNHLARYFVLAHPDDAALSQMYAPHWTILPNLGMDAIGAALLRIGDAHVHGRILLALSLFAPVIGVVAYHFAAFGRFSYWPLASGLVAYNGPFGCGCGADFLLSHLRCCSICVVDRWRRSQPSMAALQVRRAPAALGRLCRCHAAGGPQSRDRALFVSPLGDGNASVGEWRGLAKLWRVFGPFMTTSAELTLATGVAVVLLLILMRRGIRFASRHAAYFHRARAGVCRRAVSP
jgi:hypothetical protein